MTPAQVVAAFEDLLASGGVMLVVRAGEPGVKLPPDLTGDVTLDYDLNHPIPIPDLEVTEEGVRATLSFGRHPFATFVPWAATRGFWCKHQRSPVRPKLRAV